MTDKELKRLSRADLVELLLEVMRENEQLRVELAQTKEQLESKLIAIEQTGSLAEAALQLNGVFEAAQKACEQYMLNICQRNELPHDKPTAEEAQEADSGTNWIHYECYRQDTQEKCNRMEQETREKCDRMEQETKRKCDRMLKRAKQEADEYWEYVRKNAHTLHLERHKSGGSEQGEV